MMRSSRATTPSSVVRRHRIVPVPVIFHDDGQVCPLSVGKSSCPFDHEEHKEETEVTSVPNLRRLLANFQQQQRLSRVSSLPSLNANLFSDDGVREQRYYQVASHGVAYDPFLIMAERTGTDSGVGDSTVSNVSLYNNNNGNNNLLGSNGHNGVESLSSVLFKSKLSQSSVSSDVDEEDTLASLPSPSLFKRYERKQRLGVAFLSSVTPQQMANMAPDLKASMDNFISQLEIHAMKPGMTTTSLSSSSSRLPASTTPAPLLGHSDPELLMMDKPNNVSEDYNISAINDFDQGATLSDIYIGSQFNYEPLDQPKTLYSKIPLQSTNYHGMPERARLSEDARRERLMRKEAEARRAHLTAKLGYLQGRSDDLKLHTSARLNQLSALYRQRLETERETAGPLERACLSLHEELDAIHRKRLETFEIKLKPIVIKGGPSKKANYQIAAARLHYEIYAWTARLGHLLIRLEHEEQRREVREAEVRQLREEISEKKTAVTTLTKGIPFSKIEVRPNEQLPPHNSHLFTPKTSKVSAASLAAIEAAAVFDPVVSVGSYKRSNASMAAFALADTDTDDDEEEDNDHSSRQHRLVEAQPL